MISTIFYKLEVRKKNINRILIIIIIIIIHLKKQNPNLNHYHVQNLNQKI